MHYVHWMYISDTKVVVQTHHRREPYGDEAMCGQYEPLPCGLCWHVPQCEGSLALWCGRGMSYYLTSVFKSRFPGCWPSKIWFLPKCVVYINIVDVTRYVSTSCKHATYFICCGGLCRHIDLWMSPHRWRHSSWQQPYPGQKDSHRPWVGLNHQPFG